MTILPVEKKPKLYHGITPYAIALVYEGRTPEEDRDVFYADNPATYAEARFGVATRKEKTEAFNQLIADILSGRCRTNLPVLRQWIKEKKGKLAFEDLEERVQRMNKSMSLTRERAVHSVKYLSSQGTLVMKIRARSSARADDVLSYWDVTMGNFEISEKGLNPVFWRSCQCGFQGKTNNKRRLWEDKGREKEYLEGMLKKGVVLEKYIERPLDLACYHKAAAATMLNLEKAIRGRNIGKTTMPFNFINHWDLVIEAMARKYYARQNMAEIDAYLWQYDIMTNEFKGYMKHGIIHREVIKNTRTFSPLSKEIIMAIYSRMHELGYNFRGFSREFIGFMNKRKDYECVGIVFEKDKPDISYRIVYAPDSNISLPFVAEKRYLSPDARQHTPTRYQRSPLRLWHEGKKIYELDDRSEKIAEMSVHMPTVNILSQLPTAREEYSKIRTFFAEHPTRKR